MYNNDKLEKYGLIAYRVSKRERRINKVPIDISNKTRQKEITEKGEILTDKIDELLEEIDAVLEDAEEFVKNYVQKSGE